VVEPDRAAGKFFIESPGSAAAAALLVRHK